MAADVVPYFRPQFFDANGKPLDGGKVYTYKAGTTTPLTTYRDAAFTQNTNPIVLDSAGSADIFIGIQSVKFVIFDKNDVLIKTVDNVTGPNGMAVGVQTIVPITTDGIQTTFALGVSPEVPQNCTVIVKPTAGNRIVYMTSEYTVSGTNLTFASAPPAGTGEIRIGSTRAIASAGLSDNSVGTTKLQDLAVTNAKLAVDSVGHSNMQDNSVGTPELIDASVTGPKIASGAVSKAQQAAFTPELSSSSGSVNNGTPNVLVDAPNLSVTITTTGRPVFLGLVSDGSTTLGASGTVSLLNSSPSSGDVSAGFYILWTRDTTTIAVASQFTYGKVMSSGIGGLAVLPGSVWHIDTPAAGTYTYKIKYQPTVSTGTQFANFTHVKLVAYEL